ncbi:AAA family ATPase [Sunxiuqinia elliptica]|uniref:Predicted ATPase n=1 Tax=Sunxiuqinia elliptica TaxID=655355 RepID=A0A1I2IZX0_9BACT|nr:AAA family ATPase [Sunxiuqinia elliptica]SFF47278.1 Predicted ATPase [Sunxiuqinia elliptica]
MQKSIVVITGGPGFGKTSLIHRLKELNYRVGDEYAQEIIQDQLEHGGDCLPWKNGKAFRELIFQKRLAFWSSVVDEELAFADRGIPDQLAFARYQGKAKLSCLIKNSRSYSYFPYVFITSPWKEIYLQNQVRSETFEQACEIHEWICKTYLDLGYQLVHLPKIDVEQRVNFIINYITKLRS